MPLSIPKEIVELEGLELVHYPWDQPAVYFLCHGDEVVYVGSSVHVPSRIRDHHRMSFTKDGNFTPVAKQFTHAFKFKVESVERMLLLESYWIQKLKPQYNLTGKKVKVKKSCKEVEEEV